MRAPPRVNRNFISCAAPAGAAVLKLRYTTTEPAGDRATLESDLSAAPEAEMGWGVRTSPAFRFADVSLISARKRYTPGSGAEPQKFGVAGIPPIHVPVSSVRSYVPPSSRKSSIRLLEA